MVNFIICGEDYVSLKFIKTAAQNTIVRYGLTARAPRILQNARELADTVRELQEAVICILDTSSEAEAADISKELYSLHPRIRIIAAISAPFRPASLKWPSVFGCLFKPFDFEAVDDIILKAYRDFTVNTGKFITLASGSKKQQIPIKNVICLSELEGRIKVRSISGEFCAPDGSIKDILSAFPDHFVRCSDTFAVSFSHILSFDGKTGLAHLTGDLSLPVDPKYADSLRLYSADNQRV